MISIKEELITIDGVNGTKLIFKNLILNTTNIYLLLEQYGFNYAIKYSEESENFVKQVESALQTFKFTK